MKNFKHYLIAVAALVAGFAISACTPDNDDNGNKATTKTQVEIKELTPNGATINVVTKNIKEFAYMLDRDVATSAILQAGEKTTIEDASSEKTTEIVIRNLEPNTTHTLYFAFRQASDNIILEKQTLEFTTTSYGDNVLTVVDRRYDGFAVHIQIPEEVKERGNALRYSTSSLAMYNYIRTFYRNIEPDMLLFNAQQCTAVDKTVRYDEYNSYERDEDGAIVEDGAEYADPKVPGEPGVFLVGEFAWMDDTEDPMYPHGWDPGYYSALFDWAKWKEESTTDAYDYTNKRYWTGYFERLDIMTLEPETLDANIDITITDLSPIEACMTFTPTDNIAQYCIVLCTESEYQNDILPLIDGNEEHLRWLTGSYFAMMTLGCEMGSGISELWLSDWFKDTKGMAGQEVRVLVSGLGDGEGKTQYFTTTTFTLPEVTLPKPEVVVTPIENPNDPYNVTFNIKNPNYATNRITEVYFACNYEREFNTVLKEYSYTELLKGMGNPLHQDQSAMEAINSEAGFNFIMSSRENATTRLALLVYNWEGSSNNPDDPNSMAVAECTTPSANYPARVNSELFEKLVGEWTAVAPMVSYENETDADGNATGNYVKKPMGDYTSPVTISAGIEYPSELPEEVYDLYEAGGVSREKTDEYWAEFKKLAQQYNSRTRGFNRLLCMGYNFADPAYMLSVVASPYDLFTAEDYSTPQISYMFYDFGPKWNLEIDAEGNVWLPINIEREYPLETFSFGLDYTFYMLAVGDSSYLGAPAYDYQGNLLCDSRFPVEVSDDYNTITIKPIVYNYKDSNGQPATETYYPCVAQLQYGMATPLNPRVGGEVVLTRATASTSAAKANASVGKGAAKQSIAPRGEAPVPMKRAYTMTPLDEAFINVPAKIVREEKIETGSFHKRAEELVYKTYGIKK